MFRADLALNRLGFGGLLFMAKKIFTEEQAKHALDENPAVKTAWDEYNDMETQARELANKMSEVIIQELHLDDDSLSIKEARKHHVIAKLASSGLLAMLSSLSYDEADFAISAKRAREIVTNQLVPMLVDEQPCGECDECKNGHPEKCLNPKYDEKNSESRFLPLLCQALIEYDAWAESLHNNIPSDLTDEDVLKEVTK